MPESLKMYNAQLNDLGMVTQGYNCSFSTETFTPPSPKAVARILAINCSYRAKCEKTTACLLFLYTKSDFLNGWENVKE